MDRPLTPAERRLIERELIAREESKAKRRTFFRTLFVVGTSASVLAAFCSAFRIAGLWPALVGLASVVCLFLYAELLTIPRTFSQDADPRWHLNPWQEALARMSADDRMIPGIIMLGIFPIARLGFLFISMSFAHR